MKLITHNGFYVAPQVDVVICTVEQGFAISKVEGENPYAEDDVNW